MPRGPGELPAARRRDGAAPEAHLASRVGQALPDAARRDPRERPLRTVAHEAQVAVGEWRPRRTGAGRRTRGVIGGVCEIRPEPERQGHLAVLERIVGHHGGPDVLVRVVHQGWSAPAPRSIGAATTKTRVDGRLSEPVQRGTTADVFLGQGRGATRRALGHAWSGWPADARARPLDGACAPAIRPRHHLHTSSLGRRHASESVYPIGRFVDPGDAALDEGAGPFKPYGRLTLDVEDPGCLIQVGADPTQLAAGGHQLRQRLAPRCQATARRVRSAAATATSAA